MKSVNLIENIECDTIGKTLTKNDEKILPDIIIRERHHNQKYDIDFSWFDNKNTEEFAYFLGFFYADGYNNESTGRLAIVLKEDDKEILEKFSKLFFGNRNISSYNVKCQTNITNEVCSLVIVNMSLSKLVASYGAPQNKTFKIRFPYWLDKSLYKYFIRGYFDGDGSCMKCGTEYRISIASNWEFNHQLQDIIYKETSLKFGIIRSGKISILYKGGNKNTKKFLDWLYLDSLICLKRKYDRYKELLLQIEVRNNTPHHVNFRKDRNYWIFRLPLEFKRKPFGGFKTKMDAFEAYKCKLIELGYKI